MAFWKKSFLILLVMFESCLILAITVIIVHIHNDDMDKARDNALNESHFIVSSISKDLYSIEGYGSLTDSLIKDVFKTYEDYYTKEDVSLEMWGNGKFTYGSTPIYEDKIAELTTAGSIKTVIREIDGHREIFISTPMLSPYEKYTIVYSSSLEDFDNSWNKIIKGSVIFGVAVTFVLAFVLFLVLHNLTKPLRKLQSATQDIAEGAYSSRVNITGKDEFAQLAECYNSMADNIEKKIQELSDTNEQKQLLIDNMAHEIRTPLMSISGYAEYMERAKLSEEEQFESLEYIVSESKRLSKMSQILLTMAQLRVDEIPKDIISVAELLKQLKVMLNQKLQEKGMTISMSSQVDKMTGNYELVESLFINLIENAIRACSESGHINVSISKWEDNSETLKIVIEDDGIGMEESEIRKIQEPFYRVDKARSRKNGGVGLGVSLCSKIIELHNAELKYESEPLKGTKVIIRW